MWWNQNMRETIVQHYELIWYVYIYIRMYTVYLLLFNYIQHHLIFTCFSFNNCVSLPTAIKRMTTLRPSHRLISVNHSAPKIEQCTAGNTRYGALMMLIWQYMLHTCYALFNLLGQVCSKIQSWGCLQRWKLTKNLGGHCGARDFSGESKIDYCRLYHIHL